jgi:DNA-binding SARP family transcriptional activator
MPVSPGDAARPEIGAAAASGSPPSGASSSGSDDAVVGNRVFLLGSFRLSSNGQNLVLPASGQRVVAYLALANDLVQRRSVIAALWPDLADGRGPGRLRTTLWRIAQVAPGLVRRDGQWLQLDQAFSVDTRDLDRAVKAALDEPASAEGSVLDRLVAAEELLADWDDEWLVVHRERLHQLRLEALERLAEALTDRGQVGHAVQAGLAAVADDPYRESAHRVLIEAYLSKGNVAAAVDQYRRLRRMLRSDLGVVPSADLAARVGRLDGDRRRRRRR